MRLTFKQMTFRANLLISKINDRMIQRNAMTKQFFGNFEEKQTNVCGNVTFHHKLINEPEWNSRIKKEIGL